MFDFLDCVTKKNKRTKASTKKKPCERAILLNTGTPVLTGNARSCWCAGGPTKAKEGRLQSVRVREEGEKVLNNKLAIYFIQFHYRRE